MLSLDELIGLQQAADKVYVDPALISWTVDVATATRRPAEHGVDWCRRVRRVRRQPARADQPRRRRTRSGADSRGRDYVVPADLEELVRDAFRHRLVLSYRALAEEVAPDAILDQVLAAVPMPQLDLGRATAPREGVKGRL